MRDNPDYDLSDADLVRELIDENPWCTFVSSIPGRGIVASHYPVLLDEDADGLALLSHVGRPDEEKHELGRHELLAIVYGPHGYISPSWYGLPHAVPTWNFAVVHAYGVPELLGDEANLEILDRLVHRFEDPLPEPYLLRRDTANADYARRIVGGTVGFRLRVTRIEAKDKMSQDKPVEVVDKVIAALESPGPYENSALAARMRSVRSRRDAPRG